MSQITHKNLETGEFVSFYAVDGSFEYQNEYGDCFALTIEGYHATVSMDEYELVDALAFKCALVALCNRTSLALDIRLDFNAWLNNLCNTRLLTAVPHEYAPNSWTVRLGIISRSPRPNIIDKGLAGLIIGHGSTRHEAVVNAHAWLSLNSEYRSFVSMPSC